MHWDIVRHGNICGGEPVMGKAIKSVWKYRGQSTVANRERVISILQHLQAVRIIRDFKEREDGKFSVVIEPNPEDED